MTFQSTSSVWRTTAADYWGLAVCSISIHVLRVEDDVLPRHGVLVCRISIHVLRVEDDAHTPSKYVICEISIHVLRVEDD